MPADTLARLGADIRCSIEAQHEVRFARSHFSALTPEAPDIETVYFVFEAAATADRERAV
jgi:hypothetical protein